jgi:hypothetical protein
MGRPARLSLSHCRRAGCFPEKRLNVEQIARVMRPEEIASGDAEITDASERWLRTVCGHNL